MAPGLSPIMSTEPLFLNFKPLTAMFWPVICFFIKKDHRGEGLSISLLKAASEYVEKQAGMIVDGSPIKSKYGKILGVSAYMRLIAAFLKAGFKGLGAILKKDQYFEKRLEISEI
jgi:hypothetical protein